MFCRNMMTISIFLRFRFKSFSSLVVLVLAVIFLKLQNGACHMVGTNRNHHSETLDSDGKYELEWLVDWTTRSITFNVSVETKGYVGFGLSPNGKMSGADIVVGGVSPSGKPYFSDRHAIDHHVPVLDISQDWKLISASETDSHTFLSFSRAMDTCDHHDYVIGWDKISVIWAYGEDDNEMEYHHQYRGEFPVHLLTPDYSPKIERNLGWGSDQLKTSVLGEENKDVKTWTINRKSRLSSRDTSYWCTIHSGPKLPEEHHIIGFEVRFDSDESRDRVHHLGLVKCTPPPGVSSRSMFSPFLSHSGEECSATSGLPGASGALPRSYCLEQMYAWGVGARRFFLPTHIGLPLSSSHQEDYFLLQIHYDNPQEKELNVGVSIDVFYTPNLRPNVGGMMAIGHSVPGSAPSLLLPPNTVEHSTYGLCASECTQRMLPPEGIKISAAFLHSHNSGRRIKLHHFRNGTELVWVIADLNYAFDYQPFRPFGNEIKILPGDQLAIECEYDNTWTKGTVVGGYSTKNEMCVAFVYYYNKLQGYEVCAGGVEAPEYRQYFLGVENVTWDQAQLEFVVAPPHQLAGLTMTEVSDNHVKWTLEKRRELERFAKFVPQNVRCPRIQYGMVGVGLSDGFQVESTFPAHIEPWARTPPCTKNYKI